jgi:CheY-like chemotaxis protein
MPKLLKTKMRELAWNLQRIKVQSRSVRMGQIQREILCIDDDPQSLKVRTVILETLGYSVHPELDARAGLRAFGEHKVDAVVMDYEMPGMNGGEVAAEMKRLRPDVPVMIVSALPWLPESAPMEAIDAFVQKGEPLRVLARRIEDMIVNQPSSLGYQARGR